MAKVIILKAEQMSFSDKQTGNPVELTALTCLERVGEDYVIEKYYLSPQNQKGFELDMVAPDVFDTEYVMEAEFEKGVDRKTNTPKLVLAQLARPKKR